MAENRTTSAVLAMTIACFALPASGESPPRAPIEHAGRAPTAERPAGKVLTAKERLGDKSTDDQRIDNCKVPPEKRGAKPRPDDCDHLPTS